VLGFEPLLPPWALALAGALAVAAVARGPGLRGARWLRWLAVGAVVLVLAHPVRPGQEAARGPVLAVVDASASNATPARRAHVARALEGLGAGARVVEASGRALAPHTRLWPGVRAALAAAPGAGALVIVTDGRAHDAPPPGWGPGLPVHVVVAGAAGEADVALTLTRAPPGAGPVGASLGGAFRVEGAGAGARARVALTPLPDGPPAQIWDAPVGAEVAFRLPPLARGAQGWALTAEGADGEVSARNNRAAFVVRGTRGPGGVLLLSGRASPSVAAWRGALEGQGWAGRLAHYALLRTPEQARAAKDTGAEPGLALTSLPLGRVGRAGALAGVDLIVLDGWAAPGVLPEGGYGALAEYVEGGGALLVAGGAAALAGTDLARVLPGLPAGPTAQEVADPVPVPADAHPILAPLLDTRPWGPWAGPVPVLEPAPGAAVVLRAGPGGAPLMLLAERGRGRVVQIAGDGAWAWARGWRGGGPWADLVTRAARWATGDPALEPGALRVLAGPDGAVEVAGGAPGAQVAMAGPDGARDVLTLDGAGAARAQAAMPGLYAFAAQGGPPAFAVVGAAAPAEWTGLATARADGPWAAAARAAGGRVVWAGAPLEMDAGRGGADGGAPLLPPWAALCLILGLALAAWAAERRETRQQSAGDDGNGGGDMGGGAGGVGHGV
jgi:hypothetical protein